MSDSTTTTAPPAYYCAFNGVGNEKEYVYPIGFSHLDADDFYDQITQYTTYNMVPTSVDYDPMCYYMVWSGKDPHYPEKGAGNYVALFQQGYKFESDWSITKSGDISYAGTADYVHVWYDNDICKIRLYTQDNQGTKYCELHVGSFWAVDIDAICKYWTKPSDYRSNKYISWEGDNPDTYVRGIGIVGGSQCSVTLSSTIYPVSSCSDSRITDDDTCKTLMGNINDDDTEERFYSENEIDSSTPWIRSVTVSKGPNIATVDWFFDEKKTSINSSGTINAIPSRNTLDSVCLTPGNSYIFEKDLTTSTATAITTSTTKGASVTLGWEGKFGMPFFSDTKLSLSVTGKYEVTTGESTTTSDAQTIKKTFTFGALDYTRVCRLVENSYYYKIPFTGEWNWVDEWGITQNDNINGYWDGTTYLYDAACERIDSCSGVEVTTGSNVNININNRRVLNGNVNDTSSSSSSSLHVEDYFHPCTLIAYTGNDSVSFRSSYGAELIENVNNLFENITKLEARKRTKKKVKISSLENEEDYICTLYLALNSSENVNIYEMSVIKLNTSIDGIAFIDDIELNEYNGLLIIPESLLCKVTLYDNSKSKVCGPFGVGNFGGKMMNARYPVCQEMLDINGSISLGYIQVSGAQNCLAQLLKNFNILNGVIDDNDTGTNNDLDALTLSHGYYRFEDLNVSEEFLASSNALQVVFGADVIGAEWLLNEETGINNLMVDDNDTLLLESYECINYRNGMNYTFTHSFIYEQYRQTWFTFDAQYEMWTWLPATYGLPYVNKTDGRLLGTTEFESNVSEIGYADAHDGNFTDTIDIVNGSKRILNLSNYVTWIQVVNITVPANKSMRCNWTAKHGWLNVDVNFSYADFDEVFVANYSHDIATFTSDYLYGLDVNCYIIETPANFLEMNYTIGSSMYGESSSSSSSGDKFDDSSEGIIILITVILIVIVAVWCRCCERNKKLEAASQYAMMGDKSEV